MSTFLAFLGVSLIVIVTPGPDTAITIRNTLFGGRGGGVFTALGIASGQTIWAFATSLGIVALLIASAPLFLAVKYVGAAYLVYLGVQALREAARPTAPKSLILPDVRRRLSRWAAFRQGLLREDGDLLRQPTAAICRPRRSLGHGVHAAGDRLRSNDLLMAGPLCRRPRQTRGIVCERLFAAPSKP